MSCQVYQIICPLVEFCPDRTKLNCCLQLVLELRLHMYLSRAMRKCVLCHMRTTKARSLISAFVVHCLDSIISPDSIAEISRP